MNKCESYFVLFVSTILFTMKRLNIILLSVILAMSVYVNAKPLISIDTNIPIPFASGILPAPGPVETVTAKADSSKEVESLDKSESIFYGYYPYYYGWPRYAGYHYPLVYVG